MKNLTPEQASKHFPVSMLYTSGFTANNNFHVNYKSGQELVFTTNGRGSYSFKKEYFQDNNKKVFEKAQKLGLV